MLHLYDLEHNKIEGLTKYKDYKIEKTLDGIEFLSFLYPFDLSENIKEEGYIRTENNEYVIKEIDDSSDWISVTAKINLDELNGKAIDRIDVTNTRLEDSINLALAGTGYTATIYAGKNKRRTTRKAKCSALDVLDDIKKVFRVEYRFDTINKKIYVYDKMGSDKGSYFTDVLNLKKLAIKSNTYDFATRIIPIGNEGLTIESVNNGKNYVENHQYSNKIVEEYWEDNRYVDAENLKEDAKAKLDEISKRVIAYDTDIIDLANASKDSRYKVLDYELGDIVTLKSREKEVKELQRIVKITEYPDEPHRNSCELANRVLRFEDMQQDLIDSSETVDKVTNTDGTIDGDTIDGIKFEKIENFEAEIIKVTNLEVVKADIKNLKVDKADINDLNAAVARIGTLEVTKATITDLNAVKGRIETLESTTIKTVDLEAVNAKINVLEADSATIQNLVNGNLTSENIQAGSITAGSGIIADGAIGNAQISSLSVDKLESGVINTSKFTVQGSGGRLKIHDNLLQVFSGASGEFERVALGDLNKDGSRYGLRVRGQDGTTVLLNENGLTDLGFTDGYEKLGDDSLDPKKIDINKVINRVNEDGSTSISGTKIEVGNKSLDVELSERRIKETELETDISNNTTSITANTNQISLKLDEQLFTNYKSTNDNNISTINTNLSKATTDISLMQGEISLKASKNDVSTIETNLDNLSTEYTSIKSDVATLEIDLDSISQTVNSNTSDISKKAEKTYVDGQISTVNTAITKVSNKAASLETNLSGITGRVSSNENKVTNISTELPKIENRTKSYADDKKSEAISSSNTYTNNKVAEIKVTTDAITSNISSLQTNVTTIDGKVVDHSTRLNTAEQKITPTAITSTVEQHSTDLAKISQMGSLIQQNANSVKIAVGEVVRANEIVSSINLQPSRIKIDTKNLNLSGNLNLRGTFSNYDSYSNELAVRLHNSKLDFYDFQGSGADRVIGSIFSSRSAGGTNRVGTAFNAEANSALSFGYRYLNTYKDYMTFDKDGSSNTYPITTFEDAAFMGDVRVFGDGNLWIGAGSRLFEIGGKLVIRGNNAYGFQLDTANSGRIIQYDPSTSDSFPLALRVNTAAMNNFRVMGNFSTIGSKNSLQKTENYGDRLINAYETAEYYFGDVGSGIINKNGECLVWIDEMLQETINTNIAYHVFTQKYNGEIESIQREKNYFIVYGEVGTEFSWEIKGKRIGYEHVRLEVPDEEFEVNTSPSLIEKGNYEILDEVSQEDIELESILNEVLDYDLLDILL